MSQVAVIIITKQGFTLGNLAKKGFSWHQRDAEQSQDLVYCKQFEQKCTIRKTDLANVSY